MHDLFLQLEQERIYTQHPKYFETVHLQRFSELCVNRKGIIHRSFCVASSSLKKKNQLLFNFRKLFTSSVLCFLASFLAQAHLLAAYSVPDHLHVYPGICFEKWDFLFSWKRNKFYVCLGIFLFCFSVCIPFGMFIVHFRCQVLLLFGCKNYNM